MQMMLKLAASALAVTVMAGAANSAVLVSGNSSAESCYTAAARQSDSRGDLRPCDFALQEEALTHRDRIATYVNRGIIQFHRGQYNLALTDFDRALRMDPEQPEAMLNKAITLMRRDERGEEALPYFTRALDLGTEQPAVAHYGRGLAHHLNGDLTAAYNDILTATELAPEWDAPRNDLSNFIVEPNG
ncbi:tetratricopeptide repeat protein [Parasphingopyxis algicola]|uniref:tetratricopeptide repeat protein n=1 Tax=Parasphingopyxis algicola TaxID=2026624 RepID=UPI0015A3EBDA|nr:tetratricopeptide repeat protein [Parasphingopyxis algicola]QLC24293.1 tetratricopeptide repeat protein [Parasphingopyxis algicola]